MVAIDVVTATSQAATRNQGTLATGSYLRVVSATIVIYEYVAQSVCLTVLATHTRLVILSHSLPNFAFIRL
jgi:hypothetical protein